MFATGETVGLAEWIIDDTCLVSIILSIENNCSLHTVFLRIYQDMLSS